MATLGELKTYIENNFIFLEIEKTWTKNGYTAWYAHVLEVVAADKAQLQDFKVYTHGETADSEAWFDSVECPDGGE